MLLDALEPEELVVRIGVELQRRVDVRLGGVADDVANALRKNRRALHRVRLEDRTRAWPDIAPGLHETVADLANAGDPGSRVDALQRHQAAPEKRIEIALERQAEGHDARGAEVVGAAAVALLAAAAAALTVASAVATAVAVVATGAAPASATPDRTDGAAAVRVRQVACRGVSADSLVVVADDLAGRARRIAQAQRARVRAVLLLRERRLVRTRTVADRRPLIGDLLRELREPLGQFVGQRHRNACRPVARGPEVAGDDARDDVDRIADRVRAAVQEVARIPVAFGLGAGGIRLEDRAECVAGDLADHPVAHRAGLLGERSTVVAPRVGFGVVPGADRGVGRVVLDAQRLVDVALVDRADQPEADALRRPPETRPQPVERRGEDLAGRRLGRLGRVGRCGQRKRCGQGQHACNAARSEPAAQAGEDQVGVHRTLPLGVGLRRPGAKRAPIGWPPPRRTISTACATSVTP